MKELAAVRVRAGYRQLHVLLRREGWDVNHKLVYRLYHDEGLSLRRQRKRRHRSAVRRKPCRPATGPNEVWALDFVHDALFDGRVFRVLTAVDEYTRECLLLEAARSFRGETVAQWLRRAIQERGTRPRRIRVDNGTEFTAKAMDRWAYDCGVEMDFSRPGKPTDNAFIEAFNGTFRRECLSQHWFMSLDDVHQRLVYGRTTTTKPAHTARGAAWLLNRGAVRGESTKAEHGEFSHSIRTEDRGHRKEAVCHVSSGPKFPGQVTGLASFSGTNRTDVFLTARLPTGPSQSGPST
jgi:putative transposase